MFPPVPLDVPDLRNTGLFRAHAPLFHQVVRLAHDSAQVRIDHPADITNQMLATFFMFLFVRINRIDRNPRILFTVVDAPQSGD